MYTHTHTLHRHLYMYMFVFIGYIHIEFLVPSQKHSDSFFSVIIYHLLS